MSQPKTVFDFPSYQDFLKHLCYGADAKWGIQSELAKAMGCQAAYLSQVLKGKAELTEDHAVKLGLHLRMGPPETDQLLLLVRLSRAATPQLRSYLEAKRVQGVADSKKLGRRANVREMALQAEAMEKYCANPQLMAVHIALSTETLQTPAAIAKRLGASVSVIEDHLQFLAKHGLASHKGNTWKFEGQSQFLSRAPQTSHIWRTAQANVRQAQLRSLLSGDPSNFQFGLIFSTNPEAFEKLKDEAGAYVKRVWEIIRPVDATDVYMMTVDLARFE